MDKHFSLFGLLEVFVRGKFFQASLIFVSFGQIPPEWSTFRYFTVLLATDMTHKYWTSISNIERDKHFSLFGLLALFVLGKFFPS